MYRFSLSIEDLEKIFSLHKKCRISLLFIKEIILGFLEDLKIPFIHGIFNSFLSLEQR